MTGYRKARAPFADLINSKVPGAMWSAKCLMTRTFSSLSMPTRAARKTTSYCFKLLDTFIISAVWKNIRFDNSESDETSWMALAFAEGSMSKL